MASPNLLRITSAVGKTNAASITTAGITLLSNPVASNKVYKINSLFVANTDGTNAAELTASFVRGLASFNVASTIQVAADSSLVVFGKDTGIYLEEGDSLACVASQNNYLTAVISYEILG
jgi:hypothetical protein